MLTAKLYGVFLLSFCSTLIVTNQCILYFPYRDTPITAYPESKDAKKSGGLSLNKSLGLFQDVDSPFRGETR